MIPVLRESNATLSRLALGSDVRDDRRDRSRVGPRVTADTTPDAPELGDLSESAAAQTSRRWVESATLGGRQASQSAGDERQSAPGSLNASRQEFFQKRDGNCPSLLTRSWFAPIRATWQRSLQRILAAEP